MLAQNSDRSPHPRSITSSQVNHNTKLGITTAAALRQRRQDVIDALQFAGFLMAMHFDGRYTPASWG